MGLPERKEQYESEQPIHGHTQVMWNSLDMSHSYAHPTSHIRMLYYGSTVFDY